jgi:hypothetical protein
MHALQNALILARSNVSCFPLTALPKRIAGQGSDPSAAALLDSVPSALVSADSLSENSASG